MGRKLRVRFFLVFSLAVGLLLGGFECVRAEGNQTGEGEQINNEVFTLGEVEVVEKAEENKNATVEEVSVEEMRLFERNNVADAVGLLPGVAAAQTGARREATVYVRGFDIKHVPIFLDGIPIYVPYDGYPDLARFTTFDLSEVVLSKGFTSVLYGPNTMGGAINMISRRPADEVEVDAGAGYGSGDTYNVYGNFGTRQKLWYLQGGASYIDSSYFPLSDDFTPTSTQDKGRRDNSYFSDRKFNFKFGFTPNQTDEYAVSYINQHGVKGDPPYAGYMIRRKRCATGSGPTGTRRASTSTRSRPWARAAMSRAGSTTTSFRIRSTAMTTTPTAP